MVVTLPVEHFYTTTLSKHTEYAIDSDFIRTIILRAAKEGLRRYFPRSAYRFISLAFSYRYRSLYRPVKSICNFCELKLFIPNRSAPINIIAEDEEKF